jgi:LacI family transcriptional regulator
MHATPWQIVLSALSLPDQKGLFRGIRRWLDRDLEMNVLVYPAISGIDGGNLRCDGLIAEFQDSLAVDVSSVPIPLVWVVNPPGPCTNHIVAFDEVAVGRLAADHFLEQGHWQFVCVSFGPGCCWGVQREQGYAERLSEAGRAHAPLYLNDLPLDVSAPHVPSWYHACRLRAVAAFLQAQPKPLAVFAADDTLGLTVVAACKLAGLNIPSEVAVLGVNDNPTCQLLSPRLSSIALPSERVGYEAAATMSALLKGRRDVPRRTLLPPLGVVVRHSSDALQVPDQVVSKALRYMRDRPDKAIGVKELAAHVGVSRRSLERRFREAVGRTPGEEVQRLRAVLWRRLLADTDLSIAEIAQRCGFGEPTTFATAVRRTEGLAPTAYRRRAQGAKASNAG